MVNVIRVILFFLISIIVYGLKLWCMGIWEEVVRRCFYNLGLLEFLVKFLGN